MIDNPNKELKRLEDELLRSEMTDEEFERFYDELYDEFGPEEEEPEEMEDLLAGSPVNNVRNYANGYGRETQARPNPNRQAAPRQTAQQQYGAQQRPTQQRNPQQYSAQQRPQNTGRPAPESSRYAAPVKKQKGIKGLVITACVECAGIVAVVLWWVLRIL